jgi:hypothetical protein
LPSELSPKPSKIKKKEKEETWGKKDILCPGMDICSDVSE